MLFDSIQEAIREHLLQFFAGHTYETHQWTPGPAAYELPHLRVLEFAPGPKSRLWTYFSCGAWSAGRDSALEFMITAPSRDLRHVELISAAAWYHGRYKLGLGHTMPIGDPWLPGSACEFFLVSLPYPFGPALEVCNTPKGIVQVLWLLPITLAERDHKIQHGLESLEKIFDMKELKFWQIDRASVI